MSYPDQTLTADVVVGYITTEDGDLQKVHVPVLFDLYYRRIVWEGNPFPPGPVGLTMALKELSDTSTVMFEHWIQPWYITDWKVLDE